jgi:hypothetical protein
VGVPQDRAAKTFETKIKMTDKTAKHRGYDIRWQDPPQTSAGYDVSIAAKNPDLMLSLGAFSGVKGAHAMRVAGTEAQGLDAAIHYIDRVLGI